MIVVGQFNDGVSGAGAGSAWVFNRVGGMSPEWVAAPKLVGDDEAGDAFGASVGIDGGRVVVGATGDDAAGKNAGAAFVYRLDGGLWVLDAKLAGASSEDEVGSDAGAAYFIGELTCPD